MGYGYSNRHSYSSIRAHPCHPWLKIDPDRASIVFQLRDLGWISQWPVITQRVNARLNSLKKLNHGWHGEARIICVDPVYLWLFSFFSLA
jgi:hypothetical protein